MLVKKVRKFRADRDHNLCEKANDTCSVQGHWKFTLTHEDGTSEIFEYDNICPTVGRSLIATHLTSGSPTPALLINYVGLGTNVAVPANADTQLGTETYRNATASYTSANNIAYITGFFNATECNGTYKEAGMFSGATGVANSGVLISHVAINITKTITDTLTIDWTLTIS